MYKLYALTLAPLQKLVRENGAIRLFIVSYFACIAIGWLILQLPLCQNIFVSGWDTFFTTASAVSTTGLVTVDIGKAFSFSGQLVLLLLVQLGGIGYMLFSSFVILSLKQKILDLGKENSFKSLVNQVIVYTILCETIGSTVLYFFFKNEGGENSLWNAVFHSISAFCAAGFSLFSSNLEGFKNHLGINITLSLLSLLGAFGFFFAIDLFKKRTPDQKSPIQFVALLLQSLTTLVILIGTFVLLGMIPFMKESSVHKLIISFFQTVSATTTTGFNTIDIATLSLSARIFLIFLMLFGVSFTGNWISSSKQTPSFLDQKTFFKRVQSAITPLMYYLPLLLIFSLLILCIKKQPFFPLFFEVASALCTVGFSTGITTGLSLVGKSLIILLMLIGRAGILILGFATSLQRLDHRYASKDIS